MPRRMLALRFLSCIGLALSSGGTTSGQVVPDLRLDSGPPGAANSLAPQIASSASMVCVAWEDHRNGSADIYFNRSLDGGQTWLPLDARLDGGPPGATSQNPRIAASGTSVYVVWEDDRDGSGGQYVYAARSLDGGSSWSPAQRIDRVPLGFYCAGPEVAASGASVFVVWNDDRVDWAPSIYFNRSLDAGATWQAQDLRIDRAPPGQFAWTPQIASIGSSVYATWEDQRNGTSDIYLNRSTDNGQTWLATDRRLDTGDPPGAATSLFPRIAVSGSSVHVVWTDMRHQTTLTSDIYFNRSLDGGLTWMASDVRLNLGSPPGAVLAWLPTIAASGSSVYVAWEDLRLGPVHVFFNRSGDAGGTWLPTAIQLDPTTNLSVHPRLAASGPLVVMVAEGSRGLQPDVICNRSTDSGATWLPAEIRLNGGTSSPALRVYHPQIAISGAEVYVTWEDLRNGNTDVFFNRPFASFSYGTGHPGTGGATPSLSGGSAPTIGSPVVLSVTNGRGNATGWLLLGLSGRTALPVLDGTLLVYPPVYFFSPLYLGGVAGQPGAGTTSLGVPIPPSPALVGVRVNLQAMLFDPGASRGISMTNGLEIWLG